MLQWFRKQAMDSSANPTNGDLHVALTRKLIDFLSGQISQPKKAPAVLALIDRFKKFPPTYQEKELPGLYLKIENYLVKEDGAQKFSRVQLRKTIRYRYEPLMEMQNFSLIFEPDTTQEFLLSQFFFKNLVLRANNLTGTLEEAKIRQLTEWIYRIPNVGDLESPLDMIKSTPKDLADWLPILNDFSYRFYAFLSENLGEQQAVALYDKGYKDLAEVYILLDTFSAVVNLMPEDMIDEAKTSMLSKPQMQRVFLGKMRNFRQMSQQIEENSREHIQVEPPPMQLDDSKQIVDTKDLIERENALREAHEELTIAQSTAMESVKLFHGVLNTIKEGIITSDESGVIISANVAIKTIFGYDEEELVGKDIKILMPEKYREQHQKGMERYMKTRESRALNQRLMMEGLRKDKSVFPLEIYLTETKVSDQIFFTAAMRDRTAEVRQEQTQKKTSEDLRGAELRYRNLLENMNDIVFNLSLDGNFVSLNPAFARITGFEGADWHGKPFTQMMHQDDAMEALKAFQKVLQGESTRGMELRIGTKAGGYILGEFSIAPQSQNGKLIGVTGVARDITNQEESTELLKASEERFRKMVEFNPDTIGIHSNGKIVFINKAGMQLMGANSSNEILNQPITKFLNSGYLERAEETVAKVLRTGDIAPINSETLKRLDGVEVGIAASAIPVIFQNKQSIQFVFREQKQIEVPVPVPSDPAGGGEADDRAEFGNLFHISPDAIFIQELDGTILDVNPAAATMQGLDRGSLIGKKIVQIMPDDKQADASDNIKKLLRGSIESFDSAIVRIDRQEVPVTIRARQIFYMDNPAVLVMMRDDSPSQMQVAKRLELEQKVVQAEKQSADQEKQIILLEEHQKSKKEEVEKLHSELSSAKDQLTELQSKLSDSETTLLTSVKSQKKLEAEYKRLKEENKNSSTERQAMLSRLQQAERDVKKAQGEMPLLEDKLKLAEHQIKKLEADLVSKEEENQTVRTKLRKLGELIMNENS
ncbi:MAG: PAS domain S-box protein [Calditrichia bacterium]